PPTRWYPRTIARQSRSCRHRIDDLRRVRARDRLWDLVPRGAHHEIRLTFSGSPEVVLQALYVVFAEVAAALHLDQGKGVRSRIHHPVGDAGGDIDRLTGGKRQFFAVERDDRPARDH